MEKNNDTKDYSEQLELLNSEPYYTSKKIVNQSSDFPARTVQKMHWIELSCWWKTAPGNAFYCVIV